MWVKMYKMFIVIALWCELMNKYILSIWSVFFGTFDNMTQVTILRSCSCSSDALLSTCHCTIRSLLHTEDSLSFPLQLSPEFSHSRLREPRFWRWAPGGGTRTPTASRPGWRRSPCSTAAGQSRGLRRAACSGCRGDREETAPAAGSARSDCAAPWSRLRTERRRAPESGMRKNLYFVGAVVCFHPQKFQCSFPASL